MVAAAAPVALATGALLLALGLFGVRDWFWHVEPLTVTEAAAVRDLARLRSLVEDGASASAPSPVRAGILGDTAAEATPLDAAAATGADDAVAVLLQLGAPRR